MGDWAAGRYRGLRGGQVVSFADGDSAGLLVRADVARKQMDAVSVKPPAGGSPPGPTIPGERTVAPMPGAGMRGRPSKKDGRLIRRFSGGE